MKLFMPAAKTLSNCKSALCAALPKTLLQQKMIESGDIGDIVLVKSLTRGPQNRRNGCWTLKRAMVH